ncbi:MAG: lysylphosphatidylglycerol synthase transmembrane domain-containing protein [Deltaproteobacteria bacterium]
MRSPCRRRIWQLARIGISIGLVFWLFSRFDLEGLKTSLARRPFLLWAAAFFMMLFAQILSSIRWWMLSKACSFSGKWPRYLGFYFVGMFFNLFLPTGIGGDLFKVHFLSKKEGKRIVAASTVVADRFLGLVAMLFIGAVAVHFRRDLLPEPFRIFISLGCLGLLVAMGLMPLMGRLINRLRPRLTPYLELVSVIQQQPAKLGLLFALSFALQGLGIGAVALMGNGMGIHVSTPVYFVIVPLVALSTLIPISFNGIGVREGAFVYLLGLKGVDAGTALGLGLLFFSVQVAISLIGGIAYAAGVHRYGVHSRESTWN